MSQSQKTIDERVRNVIRDEMNVTDDADLQNHKCLESDLGMDSLDVVEMVIAFEEEFHIEIPDEDIDGIVTIKDAIDYITKKAAV